MNTPTDHSANGRKRYTPALKQEALERIASGRGLVKGVLENAVPASTGSLSGLLRHSDQGSRYVSHDFGTAIAA